MIDLEKIENPDFLKSLSKSERKQLATDIREFLIKNISKTGGHLASNLGVVELTIALHTCFHSPDDKLIFDVSHQTYTHKILTGRASKFSKLRQLDGLSGYSSKSESIHDFFETGHSSTSISAQSGILKAMEFENNDNYVVSVIGDASIANGMCFEALNYLGEKKSDKCIVVLNDNKMGISRNVGALNSFLNKFRKTKFFFKLKGFIESICPNFLIMFFRRIKRGLKGFIQKSNIFEDLGFSYIGPVDGHNIEYLIKNINLAKSYKKPVLFHVITQKGKGYKDAELDIDGDFHGVSANFNDRDCIKKTAVSYSKAVSSALERYMEKYHDLNVISSAMIKGSMLNDFQKKYPNNLIDVGIAEEHAATMAAGIATMNKKVYLSYYSTFSQRAYDQINHDILRQDLKCLIGLDRCGIVGEDGQTHQGIYDLSIFSPLNCEITNPYSEEEIEAIIEYCYSNNCHYTLFMRFPRGNICIENNKEKLSITKPIWKYFKKSINSKIAFIGYSLTLDTLLEASKMLSQPADIINALFIKPLDKEFVNKIFDNYEYVFCVEEVIYSGSLSSMIIQYFYQNNQVDKLKKFHSKTIEDVNIPFGSIPDVRKRINYDSQAIFEWIKKSLKQKE